MVKSSELRIGNWLNKKYGVTHNVDVQITLPDISSIHHRGVLSEFSGIELTEEWLLKFGFEFDNVAWWKGRTMLSFTKIGNWAVWYGTLTHGRIDECNINYVHQLQNLYFALTGEELQINSL